MQFTWTWVSFGVLALSGCVGTDLVIEESLLVEPRVEISASATAVQTGNTVSFTATAFDETGTLIADPMLIWQTSDASILSIDDAGIGTGGAVGQATIWAQMDEVSSDPILVTVVASDDAVATIQIQPGSITLGEGDSRLLTAVARDVLDRMLTGITFTWESTDPQVASVSPGGVVQAIAPGTSAIIARADGVASQPATVDVFGRTREGGFEGAPNTSYTVAGTATLREQPNGSIVVEFSDGFRSSAGPGLDVFLSPVAGVNAQSVNLGDLQSTTGAQSYDAPDGVLLTTHDYVVIHCVPFNVTFGSARLQ